MVWVIGGIVALFVLSGKINLSLNGIGGTFVNNNVVPVAADNIPPTTIQNQRNRPEAPASPWTIGNTVTSSSDQISRTMALATSLSPPVRVPVSVYPVRRTMQY
jgi:hypothetical protein